MEYIGTFKVNELDIDFFTEGILVRPEHCISEYEPKRAVELANFYLTAYVLPLYNGRHHEHTLLSVLDEMEETVWCVGFDLEEEYGNSLAEWITQVWIQIRRRFSAERAYIPTETKTHYVVKAKPGYVYLLRSENGYYKIGRTQDPQNRVKTFGIQLPFEVEYECLIKTDAMVKLEKQLHDHFAHKRIKGEWFNLSPDDVEYIKGLAQ